MKKNWDEYETALLIVAYVRIKSGFMSRSEAIEDLSAKLRKLAQSRNIKINDIYRNRAGIALQLSSIEFLMTNGKSGISHSSKMFANMVNIYKNNTNEFYRILNKAENLLNKSNEVNVNKKSISYNTPKTNILEIKDNMPKINNSQSMDKGTKENSVKFIDYLKKRKFSLLKIMNTLSDIGNIEKLFNDGNSIYLIKETHIIKNIINKIIDDKKIKYTRYIDSLNLYNEYIKKNFYSNIKSSNSSTEKIKTGWKINDNVTYKYNITQELNIELSNILNITNFANGYKLNSGMNKRKLRRLYERTYGKVLMLDDGNIDGVVELYGRRFEEKIVFITDKSNKLLENINNDITATLVAGIPAVFANAIFEKYKNELRSELKIFNLRDFLYAIKHDIKHEYHIQDYSNDKMKVYFYNNKNDGAIYKHLHDFIKDMSDAVSLPEIYEKIWYFNKDDIVREIKAMRDVVKVNKDMYFYAENMDITYSDKSYLIEVIKKYLDEYKFLTAGGLVNLINEECPSILTGTSKFSNIGIRNVISYILRNEFKSNGRLITHKDVYMDVYQAYEEFASSRVSFTIEELNDLKSELDGAEIPWDNILKICVRASVSQFVRNDQVHFSVWEIDKILDVQCGINNDYLPINDVTSYVQFPAIGIPWNKFVLESYLLNHSHKYTKYHNSFSSIDVYGGMVRKESNIKCYNDLIIKVLADNNNWKTKEDALELIIELGYQKIRKLKALDNLVASAKNMRATRSEI